MSETSIQHHDAHEARDINSRGLLTLAIGFTVAIGLSMIALWFLFGTREGGFSAAEPLGKVADDSELQQRDQLARYVAAQNSGLQRLAWTDPAHQSAKVPVEDGMALLAAKGNAR